MAIATIIGVIVVCVGLIILSCANIDIPGPANWLLSWTSWIGSVVGIVVAARALWKTPSLVQQYLSRGQNPSA